MTKHIDENDNIYLNSYMTDSEFSSDPNIGSLNSNSLDSSIDLLEIPISQREKVSSLEKEIRNLRKDAPEDLHPDIDINLESRENLILLLEASEARQKELREENKYLHLEIQSINAKLVNHASMHTDTDTKSADINNNADAVASEVEKVELKYQGYIEKAKYIIFHLHQKIQKYESNQNNLGSLNNLCLPTSNDEHNAQYKMADSRDSFTIADYESLEEAFMVKERQLDELQRQYENFQFLREEEEKMVVAAWYNLGVKLNRDAARDRLRLVVSDHSTISTNSFESHSFLAKQRMAHLRSSNDDYINRD